MRILTVTSSVVIAILALTGCSVKDEPLPKYDYEYEKTKAATEKLNLDLLDSTKTGGQPRKIKVSGVVVQDEKTLDSRIIVSVMAGPNKRGGRPEVEIANAPEFSKSTEQIDMTKATDAKTLVSIGCSEKVTNDLAKERSLTVEAIPAPLADSLMVISAKVIAICGKFDSIKQGFLTLNSDELILDAASYSQPTFIGKVTLNTNKLVLSGESRITAHGAMYPFVQVPAEIELNVLKEVSSIAEGKLSLFSTGASYLELEN